MLCHCCQTFNPNKKPKTKHLSSVKGSERDRDINRTRVLLDSRCGGTLINRSFAKKYKRKPCQHPHIGLPRQALSRQIVRSHVSLPYLNFTKEGTSAGTCVSGYMQFGVQLGSKRGIIFFSRVPFWQNVGV
jgi:hypothetical protein